MKFKKTKDFIDAINKTAKDGKEINIELHPKKYAFSGYKQCLYFLSYEFNDLLNFQKFSNTSFYSNTFFDIIKYKNYERIVLE